MGTKQHTDLNRGTSVWDCMHPTDLPVGNSEPKTQVYQKPYSGKPESRNQRRDPIGYYQETQYSDSANGAMIPKSASKQYTPSWSNGYAKEEPTMEGSKSNYANSYAQMNANLNNNNNSNEFVNSNELLDQAMLNTNGHYKEQTVGGY